MIAADQDTLTDRPPAVAEPCSDGEPHARLRHRVGVPAAGAGPTTPAPPATLLVLSTAQAAEALNLHPATLRRLHAKDKGPKRLQLTQTRVGYRIADLEKWLDLLAESGDGTQTT